LAARGASGGEVLKKLVTSPRGLFVAFNAAGINSFAFSAAGTNAFASAHMALFSVRQGGSSRLPVRGWAKSMEGSTASECAQFMCVKAGSQ